VLRQYGVRDRWFATSTADLLALAVARAALIPALTALAVAVGRAPYSPRLCRCARGAAAAAAAERGSAASAGAAGYVALGGPTTPARPDDAGAGDAGGDGGGDVDAHAAAVSARMNDEAHARNKRRAKYRKHALLALVFVVSTACQVYVGVKVNAFRWGPPADLDLGGRARAEARKRTRVAQILLMCSSVLFTNVAARAAGVARPRARRDVRRRYVSRELVRELTRDDGLFLPAVHAHPLVFDGTLRRSGVRRPKRGEDATTPRPR